MSLDESSKAAVQEDIQVQCPHCLKPVIIKARAYADVRFAELSIAEVEK